MPDESWLFYPETGFFLFPVRTMDSNAIPQHPTSTTGIAVPLTPWLAFVVLPKNADLAHVEATRTILHYQSIGSNEDCQRILIPGKVHPEDYDRVARDIERIREKMITLEKLRLGQSWEEFFHSLVE
ncbi:hypothetical protein [Stigmatella hybrida]|uniref:hypothetical protein n=1 Tax=Stigmatella hybrida TaxID=394097 RepID=UPI001CDAF913|nr:hypothetical protein [Stigmatella hybrida]